MSPGAVHAPALGALRGIAHAFFTRAGGVSGGLYGSNNVAFGSQDERASVIANREACTKALGAGALVTVKQHHTADVVTVTAPFAWDGAPIADALVTKAAGVAIGVLTADCAPILLADESARVIAAAHAGWRGAFDGVLENTVAAMTKLGAAPSRIVAAVGPCIAQASYEVGPEFLARFADRDPGYARFFTAPKAGGHVHFDLPGFVRDRLVGAGVGTVVLEGSDTCAAAETFFSYRRSTLRKEPDYGRQLSAIVLE
jgi:YfiH family protein